MKQDEAVIRDIVERNRRNIAILATQIKAKADEISEETVKKTYIEFGDYQQRRLESLFEEAVRQFYDAYSPSFYSRSESMYDVLNLQKNGDGLIIYDDVMDLLDRTKMTVDRKGGDLFNKVFVEGWHGGAEGINDALAERYGAHPSPGIPYYRTPHPYYTRWGKQAFRSESPYDRFKISVEAEEGGSMSAELQRILEKHNDDAIKVITKTAREILLQNLQ